MSSQLPKDTLSLRLMFTQKYLKPILTLTIVGILAVFSIAAFIDADTNRSKHALDEAKSIVELQKLPVPEPNLDEFGVISTDFSKESGYFSKRESVYGLLEKKGLERLRIHQIAQEMKKSFDPKKIYPSQRYFFYTAKNDSLKEPVSILIIEKNEQDFVKVEFEDQILVSEASRIMLKKEKTVEGVIERSLYHTLVDQKLPYDLLWKLEQVYDWKVDFTALQKGDKFRLVVEELFIGDRFVGIGEILASEFEHRSDTLKAYRYTKNGISGYYDEHGESLAKAILKAPLKYTRVSSGYSNSRLHPILKRRMPHHGVDFAAPMGTPVVSAGDGVVEVARYKGANGNYVRIKHNGTYETAYLHLRNFAKGIKAGTTVRQGQVIGYVGSTGRSTGPHLDYRVYKNGMAVNPFTLELPSNDRLESDDYQRFRLTSLDVYEEVLRENSRIF